MKYSLYNLNLWILRKVKSIGCFYKFRVHPALFLVRPIHLDLLRNAIRAAITKYLSESLCRAQPSN